MKNSFFIMVGVYLSLNVCQALELERPSFDLDVVVHDLLVTTESIRLDTEGALVSSAKQKLRAKKKKRKKRRARSKTLILPYGVILPCERSGDLTVNGEIFVNTKAPLSAALTAGGALNSCNERSGSLEILSDMRKEGDIYYAATQILGNVSAQCPLRLEGMFFADLTIESAISKSTEMALESFLSGIVEIRCGDFKIASCMWERVDLADQEAVRAACATIEIPSPIRP